MQLLTPGKTWSAGSKATGETIARHVYTVLTPQEAMYIHMLCRWVQVAKCDQAFSGSMHPWQYKPCYGHVHLFTCLLLSASVSSMYVEPPSHQSALLRMTFLVQPPNLQGPSNFSVLPLKKWMVLAGHSSQAALAIFFCLNIMSHNTESTTNVIKELIIHYLHSDILWPTTLFKAPSV